MNSFKFLFRLVFKIPATFLVIPFLLLMILMGSIFSFFSWVYEDSLLDIHVESIQKDWGYIKKWFTTI